MRRVILALSAAATLSIVVAEAQQKPPVVTVPRIYVFESGSIKGLDPQLFNFKREELKEVGVNSMKPFTDFPYLRQAFTKGEVWPVAEERIAALLKAKLITAEQAENFQVKGAVDRT